MAYRYRGTIHDLDTPILTITEERRTARSLEKAGTGCGDAVGTPAGYKRHRDDGDEACGPCKAGLAEYSREYRAKVRNGERFVRKGFIPDRCGTYAGYTHHGRHKVPACDPCKAAYNAYMTQWRNNRKQAA